MTGKHCQRGSAHAVGDCRQEGCESSAALHRNDAALPVCLHIGMSELGQPVGRQNVDRQGRVPDFVRVTPDTGLYVNNSSSGIVEHHMYRSELRVRRINEAAQFAGLTDIGGYCDSMAAS